MNIANKRKIKLNNFHLRWILLVLLLNFCLQFHLKYLDFLEFLNTNEFELKVLYKYEKLNKKGKPYTILHLAYKDIIIYSSSYKKIDKNIIKVKFINKNKLHFYEYLKARFYLPSYDIKELDNINSKLQEYFINQHKSKIMQEFYGALFFAKPISKDLRTSVNYYGIAHLLAISGYHLGLIYAVLFFILKIPYKYLQKNYFPYRSIHLDLGLIIFILLGLYFYEIGFVASYFRSFVMAILSFYCVIRAIKILSFKHLFLAFCICVSINPSLLFSVGFFFSCLGVFYIFLYSYHFGTNGFIKIIFLEISVFFAMVLPVLYFFPLISFQQLLALILTPLFTLFYPIILFLHLIKLGDLFDEFFIVFLNYKMNASFIIIKTKYFFLYLFLSLLSVKNRYLAIFVISLNILFFIYLGFL